MVDARPAVITLRINETGDAAQRAFTCHVLLDREVVAANQALSPADSRVVRELAHTYGALFEGARQPHLAAQALSGLGTNLFQTWLGPSWERLAPRLPFGGPRLLVVASGAPDILNLPWELLRPPGEEFVGADARWSVRRLPWSDRSLAPFTGALRPRPLRVLFMACAPQDQPPLDYEREEEVLLQALAGAGPERVAFESEESGTFEGLRRRINDFQPHVVHLTGHGVVAAGLVGSFCFEDEAGAADQRTSLEMAQRLFAGSGVQCVFVSGCQTGQAPPFAALGGICQGLVRAGVPLAIGWAASIADDLATELAAVFYDTLAAGQTVDRALAQARQAVQARGAQRGDPSWTLPVLYAATDQGQVFDPDPARPAAPPPRPPVEQRPLPGMTEGYAERFVGRRRELQRLLPALRSGALQSVIITGVGGAGKSALATRLARRLEAEGFVLIPIASSTEPGRENPLTAGRMLEACADACLRAGRRQEHDTLTDPSIAVAERLRYAVAALNAGRFLLVLDNFEANLEEATRRILDPELAAFYRHLVANLAGGSRAIVTSRYRPSDVEPLPRTATEEPLGDFPEAQYLKLLLRDEAVAARYGKGELPRELLHELHRLLGGTPRFLEQVRVVLATLPLGELRRELAAVALPGAVAPGPLQEKRDAYCAAIFTARLYASLAAASQRALSRAAVYGLPVPLPGLAATAGVAEEAAARFAREWQERALAYPDRERAAGELWAVYGPLRSWLLAEERLPAEERRTAHRAAGEFLRALEAADREGELGLSWVDCLLEARAQSLAGGEMEGARLVTARVSGSLLRRGLYAEMERLNRDLVGQEEHPGPMLLVARSLDDRGRYAEARDWYLRALTAAGDTHRREAASAWHGMATIDLEQGQYDAARDGFHRALDIRQPIGDRAGEAATLANLATIDLNQGQYDAARDGLHRALDILHAIGDRAGEAATLHQLASIDLNQGQYDAARDGFHRALDIDQAIGDRSGEAATLHQLASIDLKQGQYDAARDGFHRALDILQAIGDRAGEADTLHHLGFLATAQGRRAEGARLVALCFLIDQSIGHGDAEKDFAAAAGLASELQYTQEQLDAMLREVAEAYGRDRGQGLLRAAFPDRG